MSVLYVLAATGLLTGPVTQEETPMPQRQTSANLRTANVAAKQRCDAFHNKWQQRFGTLGKRHQFLSIAADVLDDKLPQTIGLASKSSTTVRFRMHASLKRNLLDETEWLKAMNQSINQLQNELIAETVGLYVRAGYDRARVVKHFEPIQIDCTKWAPFLVDGVLRKARELSLKDWTRFAAVGAGSSVATNALVEASRDNGFWKHEKGSFWDMLGKAAVGMAVEYAVDELTNPREEVARALEADFHRSRDMVLSGKHGLKWLATRLTQMHIDVRNRDLGVAKKGAK